MGKEQSFYENLKIAKDNPELVYMFRAEYYRGKLDAIDEVKIPVIIYAVLVFILGGLLGIFTG